MSTLSKKLLAVLSIDSGGGGLPGKQRHSTKPEPVYVDSSTKKNTPLIFQTKSKSTELRSIRQVAAADPPSNNNHLLFKNVNVGGAPNIIYMD